MIGAFHASSRPAGVWRARGYVSQWPVVTENMRLVGVAHQPGALVTGGVPASDRRQRGQGTGSAGGDGTLSPFFVGIVRTANMQERISMFHFMTAPLERGALR
jgi:hypothetical protein